MIIEDTYIKGLKLIHLKGFNDIRGGFTKVFNKDFFTDNGLETNIKESYYSISAKNVIRGMHFQIPPFEHTKLVYVNKGSILDVILDIRKNSSTYGQHFKLKIDINSHIVVYIPVGCAHGFLSLEDYTMVTYLQTSCYNTAYDKGIRYDSFGMEWKVESLIISERDLNFPTLDESKFDF
jgi:dTDP-4-dehydrorhamnose 3,5-epimerase